jgi:hypothetical protein
MDGNRFDEFTRLVAKVTSRRAVVKTIVAGIFGGGVAGQLQGADAACVKFGRSCTSSQKCCNGGACVNGRCACGTGTIACQKSGRGTTCVAPCPVGQKLGADCRCLCRNTGRPPVEGICGCAGEGEVPNASFPECCEGLVLNADGECVEPYGYYTGGCDTAGTACLTFGPDPFCCSGCCDSSLACASNFNPCAV